MNVDGFWQIRPQSHYDALYRACDVHCASQSNLSVEMGSLLLKNQLN